MFPSLQLSGLSCACIETPACVSILVVCLVLLGRSGKLWFILKAFNSYNFIHLFHTSLSFINYTSLIVFSLHWRCGWRKKQMKHFPWKQKVSQSCPMKWIVPWFRKRLWIHPGKCWECCRDWVSLSYFASQNLVSWLVQSFRPFDQENAEKRRWVRGMYFLFCFRGNSITLQTLRSSICGF